MACEVIRCSNTHFNDIITRCVALRSIRIRSMENTSTGAPGEPFTAIAAAQSLRHLKMKGLKFAPNGHLAQAPLSPLGSLGSCRTLTHVVLDGDRGWHGRTGIGSLSACPLLRILELRRISLCGEDYDELSDISCDQSAAAWSLERLGLQDCGLKDEHLSSLASLRLLNHLDLSLNMEITSVAALGKCNAPAHLCSLGVRLQPT